VTIEKNGLPEQAVEVIARCIDDVEQLEILLFLRRSGDRYLSASSIAEELSLERSGVFARLEQLAGQNLLDVRISDAVLYRFAPLDPKLSRMIDELARAYANQRIAVLNTISGRSTGAARAFADAFRFTPKKRQPNGE
jgi:hypothetical protein